MRHDFLHAGGFLVVGGATAATMNVVVPRSWLESVAGIPVVSVLTLALLAVILSICSEADAFVAASMTAFSPTAKLAFLVVGPMVDLKLIALQTGTFRAAVRRPVHPADLRPGRGRQPGGRGGSPVNRLTQSMILILLGGAVLRITTVSTTYLNYVKPGFRPFLIAAGVLVLVLGLIGLRPGMARRGRSRTTTTTTTTPTRREWPGC